MSRLHQVLWHRRRVGHDPNRLRAVTGADAGGDPAVGIHAHLEVGFEGLAVLWDHPCDAELLQALGSRRHADQAAGVLGHEVHRRRRHELRGHDQVAFVLPVSIIHHNYHLAEPQVGHDRFDGIEPLHHIPVAKLSGGRTKASPFLAALSSRIRQPAAVSC